MRFLISLSALILAASGAYCFAFYMNGFEGVAFVLGLALLIYGLCHVISYVIGFRKSHLPEAVFVDGVFSAALGFIAIADLMPSGSISLYFGAWLLVGGLCRFTEALAVSKVNPRNWFAVVPLSIINALFGFVLIIPELLQGIDDVYLIAIAFILQAFSVVFYALYMIKRVESVKAKEAKERAAAKKQAAELQRKERDRQRQLSESERQAELEAARLAKVKEAEEKAAARKAKKESRRPASDRTIGFTPEETAEIIALADAAENKAVVIDDEDEITETKLEDLNTRPVFNRPVNIPTIEKETVKEESPKDDFNLAAKRGLVNLEEIENKVPEIDLPSPKIEQPVIQSTGGEAMNRNEYIHEIQTQKPQTQDIDELSSLTPLTLEELFDDEEYNIKPLSDRKATETDLKLTQTFTFDWLDTKKSNE